MEPLLGTIMLFAFPRVPRGWAACDGQLLTISQYSALFSLLGTTYGGNGRTNFALPDLRGRIPLHQGQGLGLTMRPLGQQGGQESVSLSLNALPSHPHALQAAAAKPAINATATPGPTVEFATGDGPTPYSASASAPVTLAKETVAETGSGQPHSNMMPTLVMNYCIATQGIFPSRA